MPQLDTIYLFMVYLWSWFMLYLISKKTSTFKMTTPQLNQQTSVTTTTTTLPW